MLWTRYNVAYKQINYEDFELFEYRVDKIACPVALMALPSFKIIIIACSSAKKNENKTNNVYKKFLLDTLKIE